MDDARSNVNTTGGEPSPSAGASVGRSVARMLRAAQDTRSRLEPGARELAAEGAAAARRAGRSLAELAQEHEDELRRAGLAGARLVAPRLGPPALAPAVTAIANRLVANASSSSTPADEKQADEAPNGNSPAKGTDDTDRQPLIF